MSLGCTTTLSFLGSVPFFTPGQSDICSMVTVFFIGRTVLETVYGISDPVFAEPDAAEHVGTYRSHGIDALDILWRQSIVVE